MIVFARNLSCEEVVPIELDLDDSANRWNAPWQDWPASDGLSLFRYPYRHVLFHVRSRWFVGFETQAGFRPPPYHSPAREAKVAFWEVDHDRARIILDKLETVPYPPQLVEAFQVRPSPIEPPAELAQIPDFAALVSEFRKAGKPMQARLVEYMTDKAEATVQDVAEAVHADANASDKTVRANAHRTNDSLTEMRVPLSFRVASGRVFRTISPK